MQLDEFHKVVRDKPASTLADEFLRNENVAAFETTESYAEFRETVQTYFLDAQYIAVVGTANWTYSLNPYKNFKQFDETSDVDTVVISSEHFTEVWDQLRAYDRDHGYRLSQYLKEQLRRNGQNVYAGFVSPMWIPDRRNRFRYAHKQTLNALSDRKVNFKPVKMFIFRNWSEAVDYYSRGFRIAKGKL